jgi:hypothetical protein
MATKHLVYAAIAPLAAGAVSPTVGAQSLNLEGVHHAVLNTSNGGAIVIPPTTDSDDEEFCCRS